MSNIQRTIKLVRMPSRESLIAEQQRHEVESARRDVAVLRIHVVLIWTALVALTLKVCL